MDRIKFLIAAIGMSCSTPLIAQAQTENRPDPATIVAPEILPTTDPAVIKNGYKFYYFYNPSVSFDEAYQDFQECRAYLQVGGGVTLPGFVPFVESSKRKIPGPNYSYGLVGVAIGSIIAPKFERGMRSNKMRRCMEPRGYKRYPVAEKIWDQINEGSEEQIVQLQAKLATGPAPHGEAVTE